MHFKRRKTNFLPIIAVVLLAVGLASAVFLLITSGFFNFENKGAYALPDNDIKGMVFNTQSHSSFAQLSTRQEQEAFIDEFINFAKESQLNAVFVDIVQETSEGSTVFTRDSKHDTIANVSEYDTLFTKFDAMEYLCTAAKQSGIFVYALYSDIHAENDTSAKLVERTMKNYEISGTFYKTAADDGFGTIFSHEGESVPYTTQSVWTEPQQVFLHTVTQQFSGMVIDDYDSALTLENQYALMLNAINEAAQSVPTLLDYTAPTQLSITYPRDDTPIYTSTCYIMGTSDPAQPLLLDGQEVVRYGESGLFGVLVNVGSGDNNYVFSQGGTELVYTIDRSSYSGSSSSSGSSSDGTQALSAGSYVKVSGWIAGLLYDPDYDSNISETARQGGVGLVVDSVQTWRSGKSSWAYELSSGDYIMAYNTEYVGRDLTFPAITGASVHIATDGETEILTLEGECTPMAYTTAENNTLSITFYGGFGGFAPEFNITGSEMVKGFEIIANEDGGTQLLLEFDAPLYGHSIEYADNKTQIYLKKTPVLSDNILKPLEGVSVLLDAGHGDGDLGAVSVGGLDAPAEKDANLAVALAAQYRLEQLGATVMMIRTDDTFLSLVDRNKAITQHMPDFFISIHHNSVELVTDANTAAGTECYYFYDGSEALAQTLVSEVVQATGREDRGAKWGYYYVTRNTMCPAVLFEGGFMVNPAEYENIIAEEYIWAVGDAIARSVMMQLAPTA